MIIKIVKIVFFNRAYRNLRIGLTIFPKIFTNLVPKMNKSFAVRKLFTIIYIFSLISYDMEKCQKKKEHSSSLSPWIPSVDRKPQTSEFSFYYPDNGMWWSDLKKYRTIGTYCSSLIWEKHMFRVFSLFKVPSCSSILWSCCCHDLSPQIRQEWKQKKW